MKQILTIRCVIPVVCVRRNTHVYIYILELVIYLYIATCRRQ